MSLATERRQARTPQIGQWDDDGLLACGGRSLGRAVRYVTGSGAKDKFQSFATQPTRAFASAHVAFDVGVPFCVESSSSSRMSSCEGLVRGKISRRIVITQLARSCMQVGWMARKVIHLCNIFCLLSMCDHPVIHKNLTPNIDVHLLSLFCKKKPKLLQYTCFAKQYFSNVYSRHFICLWPGRPETNKMS